jgi:ribosomal 50S subunit-associated protein YjgA (DUF615 family)
MATTSPAVRRTVASLLDAGMSLDEIEEVVLDRTPLSEEERSAVWLYAWRRHRIHASRIRRRRSDDVHVPEVPLG